VLRKIYQDRKSGTIKICMSYFYSTLTANKDMIGMIIFDEDC